MSGNQPSSGSLNKHMGISHAFMSLKTLGTPHLLGATNNKDGSLENHNDLKGNRDGRQGCRRGSSLLGQSVKTKRGDVLFNAQQPTQTQKEKERKKKDLK